MKINEKIKNWIKETLKITEDFILAHPKDIKNGDYSFFLAPPKLSAKESASNEVVIILSENKITEIEKVEVAGGFINFYLSKNFFTESVKEILAEGEKFGKNDLLDDQKIIIEYTNTNVLKPMHIGHLVGNIMGESISRIIEYGGAEVKRNTYEGDVGLHIAKAVWGINKLGGIKEGDISEKSKYIGEAYALGSNSYEDNAKAEEEIKEINKKIFEKNDSDLKKVYEWGKKVSLDHFEELYKKLGTKFDFYFFESEVGDDSLKIVKEFLKTGLFEESDGAVIFRGEKFDPKLHTRVFVTKQGLPTYEAKDIAHAIRKYKEYKSDKSIVITANEQDSYFEVMLRALKEINPEIANQTMHLSHGMLKLATGKMSSRLGNVITAEDLIDQVKEKILDKIKDREFSNVEKENIAEIVAIGAIKYSILRQAIGGDIIFDFDKSISFEGDSGPYLQYTCVRANSVLERSKAAKMIFSVDFADFSPKNTTSEIVLAASVTDLERYLYRFPEIAKRAGKEYAPHYIVTYLTELAGIFNSFYAKEKIIDENDPSSPYRIALTQATAHILKSGLNLLGIKVPERM
jgi:arginyl-tRNA synthetase